MSEAKEKYYRTIISNDHDRKVTNNYVKELETENKEMLEALMEVQLNLMKLYADYV